MLFTKGKTYLLPKQTDNLCTSNKHTKAVCQAHFSWYRKQKKKEYYDFEKSFRMKTYAHTSANHL